MAGRACIRFAGGVYFLTDETVLIFEVFAIVEMQALSQGLVLFISMLQMHLRLFSDIEDNPGGSVSLGWFGVEWVAAKAQCLHILGQHLLLQ